MPFVSQEQRRWMYANKPEMAKEWEAHTPKGAKLPTRVGHKARYKRLAKKYKATSSEPGALIKAARGYRRTVLKGKKYFGETDTQKKTIKVNKKLSKTTSLHGGKAKPGGVIDSLVHESYHALHPNATEKVTYKKTPKIVKRMSPAQKKKLYSLFNK